MDALFWDRKERERGMRMRMRIVSRKYAASDPS